MTTGKTIALGAGKGVEKSDTGLDMVWFFLANHEELQSNYLEIKLWNSGVRLELEIELLKL